MHAAVPARPDMRGRVEGCRGASVEVGCRDGPTEASQDEDFLSWVALTRSPSTDNPRWHQLTLTPGLVREAVEALATGRSSGTTH